MQDFLRGLTAIHTAWPQGHPELKSERVMHRVTVLGTYSEKTGPVTTLPHHGWTRLSASSAFERR